MNYRISNYSSYNTYKETSENQNISNVIDRMIRVTAKVTEYFASDIIYDINALTKAVDEGNRFAKLLRFRDGGVHSKDISDPEQVEIEDNSSTVQSWILTHDPETMETVFERVSLARR